MDVTTTAEGAPSRPGKRERNKAAKRRRIIEAATRLFEEKGFEETTTAEISAAAEVGTGTLYLYVESKEDLLVEVFRERVGTTWDQAFQELDPHAPLADQVVALLLAVAQNHFADVELARAYFKELLFVNGPVADGVGHFMRDLYRHLDGLFEDAQRRGALRPEVSPRGLSRNLFAAWYLLMQRHLAHPEQGWDSFERRCRESVETALLGLVRPST